jgi:hypothetical protein
MALSNVGVIARVRMELQDVISGAYRWTDTELGYWIVDGAKEIARIRPEAITTYQSAPTAVTSPSDAAHVQDIYGSALVDYVCYRALAKDGEDGEQNASQRYYGTFMNGLGVRRPA